MDGQSDAAENRVTVGSDEGGRQVVPAGHARRDRDGVGEPFAPWFRTLFTEPEYGEGLDELRAIGQQRYVEPWVGQGPIVPEALRADYCGGGALVRVMAPTSDWRGSPFPRSL